MAWCHLLQECQNVPQHWGVCHHCSTAQEDATALVSTAASVTCTSMGSSRTWQLDWGLGQADLPVLKAAAGSGWAKGLSQVASLVREAPASRVTVTPQGIGASPAHATQAGQEHCVTSRSTTHVMATSACFLCHYFCPIKYSFYFFKPFLYLYFTCVSIFRCVHGTCLPINSYSYSCRCQPGHSGVLCDEQDQDGTNPCSLSHCKHGKCRVSGLGKAYCECNSGYIGEACERGEFSRQERSSHLCFIFWNQSVQSTILWSSALMSLKC